MYILICVILSLCVMREVRFSTPINKRHGFVDCSGSKIDVFYYVIWVLLTIILCIRYRQGTDYVEYEAQFEMIDANMSFLVNALYHGEIGWYMLMLFSKKLGLSFDLFIAIISLLMMLSMKRAVKKFSPYPLISLLLFFPTYYLTYCQSAIRQGFVLCLFLGFGLEWLFSKKTLRYFVLIAGLSLLHFSAGVLFVLPFVYRYRIRKDYFVFILLTSLVVVSRPLLSPFIVNEYDNTSPLGVLVRVILMLIVLFLYKYIKERRCCGSEQLKFNLDALYTLYVMGYGIAMLFSFYPLASQRLSMPLKAIEILLIPLEFYIIISSKNQAVFEQKLRKRILVPYHSLLVVIVLIVNVETYKNLNAYIDGYYREGINAFNYPIITVFNKSDVNTYKLNE